MLVLKRSVLHQAETATHLQLLVKDLGSSASTMQHIIFTLHK